MSTSQRLVEEMNIARAPLRIDRDTGACAIVGRNLVLSAGQATVDCHRTWRPYIVNEKDYAAGHRDIHTCLIKLTEVQGDNVWLRLAFEDHALGQVSLAWGPTIGLEERTDARVEAEAARYRNFMSEELGPSGVAGLWRFPWGRAFAGKDPRSGGARAALHYRGFFDGLSVDAVHPAIRLR